jgi:adenosylcobinamide kinase/adenosylcobinamide-phosphate guanylyltransferase
MILILGGEGSGKRSFAESLGYSRSEMADGVFDERPVFFHLERLVLKEPEKVAIFFEKLREKEIVICNEVGSGLIPMTEAEREARRAVGRISILLAQEAETVLRMIAGIPTVLKGNLPS